MQAFLTILAALQIAHAVILNRAEWRHWIAPKEEGHYQQITALIHRILTAAAAAYILARVVNNIAN